MAKIKKDRKNTKKQHQALIYTGAFVLSFAILFSLVFGVIQLSANWENIRAKFSVETWTYTLGLEEDEYFTKKSISSSTIFLDNVAYLNMSDIAQMCNLTVVGDFNEITYFNVDSNDQRITFYYGSDKITVNGEHYKLNGIMFENSGNIFVPASFVSQFCSGIIVEIDDDKHTMKVYRHSLGIEYDPLDNPYHIYEDIKFATGSIQPIKLPDRGLMFSDQSQDNNDER